MRNPIEAVTVLLLTEEEEFRPTALEALNEINERLSMEYFTNIIVVPWEWDQWLYLKK